MIVGRVLVLLYPFIFIYYFLKYKHKKKSFIKIGIEFLFIVYIHVVLSYTVFPLPITDSLPREGITIKYLFETANFKLIFFQEEYNLIEAIANIFLFIPFGFLYKMTFKESKRNPILVAFCFTLLLEMYQFLFNLLIMFPYRLPDINDILLNSIGAVIGLILYSLFIFILRLLDTRYNLKEDISLIGYILS